ncbi:SHOCT domain-containing protein [Streptomyces aureus]|uniref:SHOCT domain-containing protein n=1 Tax=Streptomyces aureus TaxID=193461 RepID=UPI0006E35AE1|nr:SHOCT domain-containing protein [Streptomyces aureus]
MFLRRRPLGRPVIRPAGAPLLRGALVGGAAYAAGRSSARAARREQDQEEAIADLQTQQLSMAGAPPAPSAPQAAAPVAAASAPAAPVSGGAPSVTDQLVRLGELAQQGLLTPEEFAAAKAQLLGV